jgi:hypothetical protein
MELLHVLLTINTFVSAMCISFVGSTFSAEDFANADLAFARGSKWYMKDDFWKDNKIALGPDSFFVPSVTFAARGWTAMICLVISLFLAIGIFLSLMYSGSREDEKLFRVWKRVFHVGIMLAWALFIVGCIFFFAAVSVACYIRFPKYCGVAQTGGLWLYYISVDSSTSLGNEGYTQSCIVESMNWYQGGNQVVLINSLCAVCILLPIVTTVIINTIYKMRNENLDK